MKIQTHHIDGVEIAEIVSDKIMIHNASDALDIMGTIYYQGYDKMILHQKNLTTDFFDLKNKMAGEILQKFSNYRIRLVIVGEFSIFPSKSLQDFIRESNRGSQVNFVSSMEEALNRLSGGGKNF